MTKELSKGFTGIEVNGVQFSNIREMLIYMDKQRDRIADLELKIKKMTQHLEPQTMSALFEQVEEEVEQEQRIKKLEEENAELKAQIEKMKCCRNCKKLDNRKVECSEGSDLIYFFGKNCDKWEIKEND